MIIILLIIKQKCITKPTKGKYKKVLDSVIKILQKIKNIKNRNYANNRNRNMSVAERERRKENVKHYHYKRKNIVEFV